MLVAVGAGGVAAGDPVRAQVSSDSRGRLAIDFAEAIETVSAPSRYGAQKPPEQIHHHTTTCPRGRPSPSRSVRNISRAFARRTASSGIVALQVPAERSKPDARRPRRLLASFWGPDGRRPLLYSVSKPIAHRKETRLPVAGERIVRIKADMNDFDKAIRGDFCTETSLKDSSP